MATVSAKEQRALVGIAIYAGALAVVALPIVLAAGEMLLGVAFSLPLTLAAAGRLLGSKPVEFSTFGALALLLVGVVGGLPWLAIGLMALGAVAVVFAVGTALSRVVPPAAQPWRLAAVVGLVLGYGLPFFMGEATGGAGVALPVLAVGAVVAHRRARKVLPPVPRRDETPRGGNKPAEGKPAKGTARRDGKGRPHRR